LIKESYYRRNNSTKNFSIALVFSASKIAVTSCHDYLLTSISSQQWM
jgi:hypothetical protein